VALAELFGFGGKRVLFECWGFSAAVASASVTASRTRSFGAYQKSLCAVGRHQCVMSIPSQEVLNTIRLFGEQVIPHFQAREARRPVAEASA
jgi:hypothetical protein